MKIKPLLLPVLGVMLLLHAGAPQSSATLTRFIQIVKADEEDTRFHLGEVEAFEDGVTPNGDGPEFDGRATSTNDIGDGELTTYGDGEILPDIGTTDSLEHGGANKDPNNQLENAGSVWSTANGLGDGAQYTLDLGAEYDVTTLRLWPRADDCCSNRWRNLEINLYGDDNGKPGTLNATETHTEDVGNVSLEFTFPVAVNTLTEGLIGYWSFNDLGDGVTEALDASSNGNNGTVNGEPAIVAGPSGLDGDFAIDFDGIDDSVTTEGSIMNDIDEFTMSGWVRFEEQPGNRVGLFGQNDAVEYGMINPTTMQHWSAAGGAFDVPFGPVIEEWTSIVLVNTPEQRILYVDGEEVASGGGTNPANSGFSFNIGGDGVYDDAGNFFTGQMDDVAVWGRALTPEEAKQVYETRAIISPDFIDTDGDGMPDGYETNNGLNPFDAADKDTDLDGDTVSNFAEFTNRTNPNDKDTDKDGLEDGVETGTGVWVSAENTGTLPTKVDSDKDGLLDGVETNTGTFVSASDTGTDPNKEDSDGDTFGDSQEIVAGSDPTDPNSKPEGGLLAAWDFEDSADDSVAVDVVNGIEAINDGAVYADDPVRGSVIDFEGAAGTLHVDDASFLSLAAATDQMTFVFWQLNADTVSSSTFWAVSPSSSGGSRGAQAHVPWDAAGNIYFDTVGCCDGNQRGTFTAGVDFLDGEWHHYAFVKDGEDKRVYIDGALEYEIVNTSPLPDDFTELWIGSAPNNTSIVQAKLDDFGVYSIALTEEQINEVKDNGLGGGTGVPFQIIEVKRISATNAEVTWQSKEGRSYTMEHTGGFVDWIEVSDGLESNGETTTFEDSTLTSEVEERYYRVREE